MEKQNPNNISTFEKGLNTDYSPNNQPKSTYRFALNAVNESNEGDVSILTNEESNKLYSLLTDGYSYIGKILINNNKFLIFSVSHDNKISEIGILDNFETYTPIVNDKNSSEKRKLNFRKEYPIHGVYRLRRGCEHTVYFTDNYNDVRYFNLSKLKYFKTNEQWDSSKFSLHKTIEKIPSINKIEVIDNYGQLSPGKVSIFVQYLDEDLNGTAFINLISNIKIFNDQLDSKYENISGSSKLIVDNNKNNPYYYENTTKAIKLSIKNIDKNFIYLRYAFVIYEDSIGKVSNVYYSQEINVNNNTFIFTGNNYKTKGSIDELMLFDKETHIKKAKYITQNENRLLLANTSGDDINMYKLQKYASKIKVDCVKKEVSLTNIKDPHNSKNPLCDYYGLSLQPGEIYSIGIEYIFEDNTSSFAYHIPGKSPHIDTNTIYSKGKNVVPMSNVDNQNKSEYYTNIETSCPNMDFWGLDCEGMKLRDSFVRHHRVPDRKDIDAPLIIKNKEDDIKITNYKSIQLLLDGVFEEKENCTDCEEKKDRKNAELKLSYNITDTNETKTQLIKIASSGDYDKISIFDYFEEKTQVNNIKLYFREEGDEEWKEINLHKENDNYYSDKQNNGLIYKISFPLSVEENKLQNLKTTILGLKFSNIEFPSENEIGKKIIGYRILIQERKDEDKTILDSAVLLPVTKAKFGGTYLHTSALLIPYGRGKYSYSEILSEKAVQILSPGYQFKNKTYDEYTTIEEQARYKIQDPTSTSGFAIQDVLEGSSADGFKQSQDSKDDDGWSLKNYIRYAKLKYDERFNNKLIIDNKNKKLVNLNAVSYFDIDNDNTIYNLSNDNRSLILFKEDGIETFFKERYYPYVYIKSNKTTFYQNYRMNPYYKMDNKIYNTKECTVFGGDTYISPLKYSTHTYLNSAGAYRRERLKAWQIALGIVTIGIAIVVAVLSGGTLAWVGAGLVMLGSSVFIGAAIVEVDTFSKLYKDKWTKGLGNSVTDWAIHQLFINDDENNGNQMFFKDDTFRWIGEAVDEMWFESQINMSLRVMPRTDLTNFIKPFSNPMNNYDWKWNSLASWRWICTSRYLICTGKTEKGFSDITIDADEPYSKYFYKKIIFLDPKRNNKPTYTGISSPVIYFVNPDYDNDINDLSPKFSMPLTYDGCSECKEKFPHRIHYSEQSFQEEKTDNYRMFLPNNYKDIQGETGEITNIFSLKNNIFIHTEKALWLQPKQYQERVTDQIVTYIGSGSYFELPPRKIIDDETNSSAGTKHKFGTLIIQDSYIFISENERKIYIFNGQQLNPISNKGLNNYFQNNMKIMCDNQYYDLFNEYYPLLNNPYNEIGTGYIIGYDNSKTRLLITKKDCLFKDELLKSENDKLIFYGNKVIKFKNYKNIIKKYEKKGYTFIKFKEDKMIFEKIITKVKQEKRLVEVNIFKEADYILFRYNFNKSNGRDLDTRTKMIKPFESETLGWHRTKIEPKYNKYIKWGQDNTGYGVECIAINLKAFREDFHDINELEFSCRAFWYGEKYDGNMNMNAEAWKGGNLVYIKDKFNFIAEGGEKLGDYDFPVKHIPTKKSSNIDGDDVGHFIYDLNKGELKWDDLSGGKIPPREKVYEEKIIDVEYEEIETLEINGEDFDINNIIKYNNSWTLSFDFKIQEWISWHSYLPNDYLQTSDKFYTISNNKFYLHNVKGNYNTFYENKYPFIIEYVAINNPLQTSIYNYIMLNTTCLTYNENTNSFIDDRYTTFNKMILYNSRQCSGEVNLIPKNIEYDNENYLLNQVVDNGTNNSIIDRTEKDWFINDFRDIRINYDKPIWLNDLKDIQVNYYIDKELNLESLDYNKSWEQLEPFKDKYLSIRFIMDKFVDKKLSINFSMDNTNQSYH